MKRSAESGQVLLTGIVMMLVLLLIILYAFDVHNVIRAKMKVEIAQQAAAMTGANWQKESLNLIGEINLVKASALLLEGSENWRTPLPDRKEDEEAWRKAMQTRIDLLTEMQTRVSFIGPLIGCAAAQQAAKANGLNRIPGALNNYLALLRDDKRYIEAHGGAPRLINNYDWREPYIALVEEINNSGIAVFPNARVAGSPETIPKQLADGKFYTEIMRCAQAVADGDPPTRHFWYLTAPILRAMDDKDFNGRWWRIGYNTNRFPNESEIFTLGVEFGSGGYDDAFKYIEGLSPDQRNYADGGSLPASMAWCLYDDWWDPDYYRNNYSDYEENHYNFWFGGDVLRKEIKPQYRYEGPAAYAEGFADVSSTVNIRPSVRPYAGSRGGREAKEAIRRREHNVLLQKGRTTARVGTRRGRADNSDVSTSYRPGSIAKVLGELQGETPPSSIDIILPVFNKVSVMPTYMPVPYGFQVLKPGYSNLEKFLSWLATRNDLDGVPPEGTEEFLEALRFLVFGIADRADGQGGKVKMTCGTRISGRALRYYGYNHKFNKGAFENEFRERLYDWKAVRDKRVFQQTVLDGPGWLQEPALFSSTPTLTRHSETRKLEEGAVPVGRPVMIGGERHEVIDSLAVVRNGRAYPIDEASRKVAMPDNINGGTAHRVYVELKSGAGSYYVINSKGAIVLNGQNDPTILYNRSFGGGGSGNYSTWNPGSYDNQRGPARL